MSSDYAVGERNKVRQLRDKARYDRETVHAILDAGLVAHVGLLQDGAPVVVPMLYGRDGDTVYLHGARKARVIRMLETTGTVFASSMNYRSVTIFGSARLVGQLDDKKRALHVISEHAMPGRRAELRLSHENELKMTGVIAIDIESASAKVSTGMPDDEPCDLDTPVWAGVLPIETRLTTLLADERVGPDIEPSAALRALENTKL